MTDRINGTGGALAALRALVQRGQRGARPRATAGAAARTAPATQAGAAPQASSPLVLLPMRVAAIPADDPLRERTTLRYFIEAVLAEQFGESVLLDPAFAVLVRQVTDALDQDEATQALARRAVAQLLDGAMQQGGAKPAGGAR